MNCEKPKRVDNMSKLGVKLDADFTFDGHINVLLDNQRTRNLCVLYRSSDYLDRFTTLTLIKVRSYCSLITVTCLIDEGMSQNNRIFTTSEKFCV